MTKFNGAEILKNQPIQDLDALNDSVKENKKKFDFWNEIANLFVIAEADCPDNKVDQEIFNHIKEAVGVRMIELVKILKVAQ